MYSTFGHCWRPFCPQLWRIGQPVDSTPLANCKGTKITMRLRGSEGWTIAETAGLAWPTISVAFGPGQCHGPIGKFAHGQIWNLDPCALTPSKGGGIYMSYGCEGFSPCVHLPRCHFGTFFLSQPHTYHPCPQPARPFPAHPRSLQDKPAPNQRERTLNQP